MQLPFLKKTPPKPNREYFFALEISPGIIKSAVWTVINAKTQVLSTGIHVQWDNATDASLITAVDQSLSDATSKLDASGKISPDKAILGLPPDWIESEKIIPTRLQLIKVLSTKLSLKPVGYVVTPEAVVKFLTATEGVPPTAILLGFWPHFIEVTLARLGKVVGSHEVARSSKLADDVVEGLSRFVGIDLLPSRILLYDSGLDLEDIKQQLLAYPWQAPQTRLPFLHFPKIEVMPSDFTIKATALAGGTEVAKAIGILVETAPPEPEPDLGFVPADQAESLPKPAPIVESPVPQTPIRKFSLPRINLLIPLIMLILLILLVFVFWFVPKATVNLRLEPKSLSAQFDFVAGPDNSSALDVTVSDTKSAPATGSKLVGDKATGSVTISNALDTTKSFPAGTVLASPAGLKFALDSAVSVASASGSAGNLLVGKASVKITASQIGGDSNLTAGTVFRVGTFALTQISAQNETAFSGGSSRTAIAVSKDDIAKLRSDLSDSLKATAKSQLADITPPDHTLLPETIKYQTDSEKFDHKEGDIADSLSLSLSLKATALSLSLTHLQSLVDEKLTSQIPAGYEFSGSPQYTFTAAKDTLATQATATLRPKIDPGQIIPVIKGKSATAALTYLTSLTGVSGADIVFSLPLQFLPLNPSRIQVNVQ
ncbi:MAG: hypothetical protein G01um101416_414 [Microgenomates group bacterium Gr01-1014_16]|nr:MAG: hypothetical protein G01um101416_414 [Microgenomates group bacterium Gr01-1014_16]